MAVKFLDNLDLNDNQLLNARLENLASDPGSANAGDVIYNTTSNTVKYYNGSGWISLTADTNYDGWELGDGSSTVTISSGNTAIWSGGTGITTALDTKTITISADAATATTRGAVELFSNTVQSVAANSVTATASRSYGLQLNSDGQAVVNVPWTDTSGMTNWTVTADSGGSVTVGDGQTVDWAGGTGISTAYSTPSGNRTVTITNSLPFNSLTLASTTGSNSTISNSGTITIAAGTGITTTNDASGTVTIAATGSGSMSSFTAAGDSGSNQTISDGNTLTIAGGTGIDTVGSATDTITATLDLTELATVTLSGDDELIILSDGADQGKISLQGVSLSSWAVPTGNIAFNSKKITGLLDPTAAQDGATKAYVDSVVVGNLVFQGGYNAATNTPDLDSSPSSSIKKGWSYVVTAAGSFFTETVEVGDFLIAQQDTPTTLAHWVTVQNNIGIATTTTPGIASFADASFAVSAAGEVTLDDSGVTAATYGSASAVPVFAVNAKGQVTSVTNTNISIAHTAITDFDAEVDARITAREFDGTNSGTGTSHTFTHNLGTRNVIVQLYDSSTYETVFAKVVRTSTSVVTVTTASSLSAGEITALITVID